MAKFYLQAISGFKRNVPMPVGEIDLEMLSVLRSKHPGVAVDNEVLEPSAQQLHNYKGSTFLEAHTFCIPQVNTVCISLSVSLCVYT